MAAYVDEIGFLPLLPLGVRGWSAQEAAVPEFDYTRLEGGGWEWPLWQYKGDIIAESGCAYGKFLLDKAFFISRQWWPDFCNWRRSLHPAPEPGSVEEAILFRLNERGSLITRELRAVCGFTEPKSRGRFDTYITRLERACRITTESFVYPAARDGKPYGWGWSLLTTPERLLGRDLCQCPRTPRQSFCRLAAHFRKLFPYITDDGLHRWLG